MTKIQIELPDATAQAAQAAGLLTPQALDRLLSNALRKQQAADYLLYVADERRGQVYNHCTTKQNASTSALLQLFIPQQARQCWGLPALPSLPAHS